MVSLQNVQSMNSLDAQKDWNKKGFKRICHFIYKNNEDRKFE